MKLVRDKIKDITINPNATFEPFVGSNAEIQQLMTGKIMEELSELLNSSDVECIEEAGDVLETLVGYVSHRLNQERHCTLSSIMLKFESKYQERGGFDTLSIMK